MARAQMQKDLAKALKQTEGELDQIAREGNIDVASSMRQRSVSVSFHVPYSDMRHFTTFPCFQYRAPGGGRRARRENVDEDGAQGRVAPPRAKVAKRKARAAPKGRAPAKRARAKKARKAAAVPTTPTSPEEASQSSSDWSYGEGGDGGDNSDGAAGAASGPPAAGAACGPPPARRARLRAVVDSEDDLDVPLTQRGVPVPANLFPSEEDSDLDRPLAPSRRNLDDQLSQAPTQNQSAPAGARA